MTTVLVITLLLAGLGMAWPDCPHRNQTLPITLAGKTYRVCLDCTRQLKFRAYR